MKKSQLPAYHAQQQISKQKRNDVKNGKISKVQYLQYYYSIPFRLRKAYGVPQKAPEFGGQ